jgi:hypothetical protein
VVVVQDVRALLLVLVALEHPLVPNPLLLQSLRDILIFCHHHQVRRAAAIAARLTSTTASRPPGEAVASATIHHLPSTSTTLPPTAQQRALQQQSVSADAALSRSHQSSSHAEPSIKVDQPVAQLSDDSASLSGNREEVEEEVMCVDVTETMESVEVCTTSPSHQPGQAQPSSSFDTGGPSKRSAGDGRVQGQ